MKQSNNLEGAKPTNFRWTICLMLFLATTVNYLDRQVLSLTWKDFIAPEFHWTDEHYGTIAAFFSIAYAISMLFAGRFIDIMGTKKGYLWAIGVWSFGACAHALCGVATEMFTGLESAAALQAVEAGSALAFTIASVSTWAFLVARTILALGEAGNFPAAIKVTAEYFPKRDRAFATSIFNAGATVGALAAPLTIPFIARYFRDLGFGGGWEAAFLLIGALGFIWMGFWIFIYKKPTESRHVNQAELDYINSDNNDDEPTDEPEQVTERKVSMLECFRYRQTWAFVAGKFMTDGVWWFFLFWTPAYLSDVYGYSSDSTMGMVLIFTVYAISMLSIYGGKLPTIIMNKSKKNPYSARMQAMLIFAFFPLLALFAQPLGNYSPWFPVIIIGIAAAAHQSWSANIFTTVSDMFPKSMIGTIVGIGSMAGGVASFIINLGSGKLFTYAGETGMTFLGFEGKPAGYFIIFIICSVAYLLGWSIMKMLVPKYSPIKL
ncbi:MAG: MFS transporter [Rikenellaceae bacterium]